MQKKTIQYGFQFRDEERGVIVNWYPKKGTVFAQKNNAGLTFPNKCFKESELIACFSGKSEPLDNSAPSIGICSDAGTHGNPGPCEYNVAELDGTILDHKHLGVHSNNYAELYGILAGLEYCMKSGEKILWTDSQVCLSWIKNKRVGKDVHEKEAVLDLVDRINILLEDKSLQLKKWHTKLWGEIKFLLKKNYLKFQKK